MTSRRELLRSLLAAGALAAVPPRAKRGGARSARVIPIGLLLDPDTVAGRGVALGMEEAQRAGELLHIEFRAASTSGYALIGLLAPKVEPAGLYLAVGPLREAPAGEPARPRVYSVASSPDFRRQALGRHPDRKDLRVVDWHPSLQKFGADALNLRFQRRFNHPMDEAAWRGWMAVKLAAELALRYPGTSAGTSADTAAVSQVNELSIDGHKGMPLRFDPKGHHLIQPVYLIDPEGKVVDEVAPEWAE
jgi:hypothetical protein